MTVEISQLEMYLPFKQKMTGLGGSPGLVVMGGDSCSKVPEFKSQQWILDGNFLLLIVVQFVMFV